MNMFLSRWEMTWYPPPHATLPAVAPSELQSIVDMMTNDYPDVDIEMVYTLNQMRLILQWEETHGVKPSECEEVMDEIFTRLYPHWLANGVQFKYIDWAYYEAPLEEGGDEDMA